MAGRVLTIAAGTPTIKLGACADQADIVEVIVPASLLTIEKWAFSGCTGIKRIDLSHTRATALGKCAFHSCTSLTEVMFPDTLVHKVAFLAVPPSLKQTYSRPTSPLWQTTCFLGCTSLSTVMMPATLTVIGSSSVRGCRAYDEG